jgi:hypothetical protein
MVLKRRVMYAAEIQNNYLSVHIKKLTKQMRESEKEEREKERERESSLKTCTR